MISSPMALEGTSSSNLACRPSTTSEMRRLMRSTSPVFHNDTDVFKGLPNPFLATRYHSLVVERSTFPACLEVTAWTEDGLVMGLRHRELPVWGVQFHPELFATQNGLDLLGNFLRL